MTPYKVLTADDEPCVFRASRRVLQKEGYQVSRVVNGREALDVFDSLQPVIVVTDAKMPHPGGQQPVKTIRAGAPSKPVVVMTSALERGNREWVHDLGNISFLGKPVGPSELVRVINTHFIHSKAS